MQNTAEIATSPKSSKISDESKDTPLSPIQELEEAENLVNELKSLLVKREDTLDDEGIRHQVEILERWMESYRRGLSAAQKISENGALLLGDLRNHLKLSIDERHRLEGEGGNPPTREESDKLEKLTKTLRHIEQVLPNIEHVFSAPVKEPEDA